MPRHPRFSVTFFCVFPFFQGKEPSDQHIKQVCMRVMQGETWWAFDPIYHFLCASFHGFNLSQNASLHSRVQRRRGVVSLISPLAKYSQVGRREREEGPIARTWNKASVFVYVMDESFFLRALEMSHWSRNLCSLHSAALMSSQLISYTHDFFMPDELKN